MRERLRQILCNGSIGPALRDEFAHAYQCRKSHRVRAHRQTRRTPRRRRTSGCFWVCRGQISKGNRSAVVASASTLFLAVNRTLREMVDRGFSHRQSAPGPGSPPVWETGSRWSTSKGTVLSARENEYGRLLICVSCDGSFCYLCQLRMSFTTPYHERKTKGRNLYPDFSSHM